MANNAFVFIDGSNFYFKLKDLTSKFDGKFSLLDFDFGGFAKWLVEDNNLIEVHYYIGAVKRQPNSQKSEKMYANQQRLLRGLQRQNVIVSLGQLIRHPDKTNTALLTW